MEPAAEQKLDREITSVIKHSGINRRYYPASRIITYAYFLSDKMLVTLVIRNGVPYSLFNAIQSYTPFTESDWAHLLDLSTKSLQRYKQSSKNFKPLQSEKIIELSEVTITGLDVFGDMEKFKLWLETPNFALGQFKPLELLSDSYGTELVMAELININYGIFA